jgi:hypothetical protein
MGILHGGPQEKQKVTPDGTSWELWGRCSAEPQKQRQPSGGSFPPRNNPAIVPAMDTRRNKDRQ